MTNWPTPHPTVTDGTFRPDAHPDHHNADAAVVTALHDAFPEALDWSAIWLTDPFASHPAEFTDVTGTVVLSDGVSGLHWEANNGDSFDNVADWQDAKYYSTSAPYVRGTDGNIYTNLATHTSTPDTRPVDGVNWQTRWERTRPIVWALVDIRATFTTTSNTGYRDLHVDLDPASEFEPPAWATPWFALGQCRGWNFNQWDRYELGWTAATGRLSLRARGHQASQGPNAVRIGGWVPLKRKATP